ncbi:MAG TPA: DUF2442 domain-containing protein, partial [Longimicrobiaceae bacterium]|nr:DUF2442 domain-containing protein [Longimicrobiaceae bacterium]
MDRRTLTDDEIRASVPAARARGVRAAGIEPRAVEARYDADSGRVLVELEDGCLFGFPRDRYPELASADPKLLEGVTVEQDGEALHWEALDVDISVPGLVARSLKLR